MFERFTNQSRRAVVLAQEEARSLHHNYIGTEHILLGLLQVDTGSAAPALTSVGVTLDAARREVEANVGLGEHDQPSGHIPFTKSAKKSLELSLRESIQLGHGYIGTGHLLLGLIRQDDVAVQILGNLGADLTDLRTRAIQELQEHPEHEEAGFIKATRTRLAIGPRQTREIKNLLEAIDARLTAIEQHLGITRASGEDGAVAEAEETATAEAEETGTAEAEETGTAEAEGSAAAKAEEGAAAEAEAGGGAQARGGTEAGGGAEAGSEPDETRDPPAAAG
jgi:ATP-dependent Clp protease ATP-binding subunit ClpA